MIRIEADTLEEAYSKAAAQLSCSVTQILFDVVQNPSSGFLGMFKKSAIIDAKRKGEVAQDEERPRKSRNNRRNKNRKKEQENDPVNRVQEKEKSKP